MNKNMEQFLEHNKKIEMLHSASGLLNWDQNVNMPPDGIKSRSDTLSLLHSISYDMFISEKTQKLLDGLENEFDSLSEPEKAMVIEAKRDYLRTKAVPKETFEKMIKLRVMAQQSWQKARQENDFSIFSGDLKEIVSLTKEVGEIYREKIYPELDNGYEALMSNFEPGMKSERLKEIIAELQPFLTDMLSKIKKGNKPDESLLAGKYPKNIQLELSKFALEKFGYNFKAGRMDLSTHPFTTGYAPGDVRITTRVSEDDFSDCFYSSLHEGGHAIYEQGLPEEYIWTPLHSAASFGIHESQSRLWENNVGRSKQFIEFIHPHLKEYFPGKFNCSTEELYRSINTVKPSMIRTEADEVTYNLHIMLRFEIEIALFEGSITVDELPSVWNQLMEKYLGIKPATDSEGVLQDVHWSWGMFGYFPSYMLGNLYAAQIFSAICEETPETYDNIRDGEFGKLKSWLNKNIHSTGKLYTPDVLIRKTTGKELSTKFFMDYIDKKYSGIYEL